MDSSKTQILEIFSKQKTPISAIEIQNLLAKDSTKIHLATVYRTLHKLEIEGSLSILVSNSGQKLYQIIDSHSHYFECLNCQQRVGIPEVKTLESILDEIQDKLQNSLNFQNITHSLSFMGICNNCQI